VFISLLPDKIFSGPSSLPLAIARTRTRGRQGCIRKHAVVQDKGGRLEKSTQKKIAREDSP